MKNHCAMGQLVVCKRIWREQSIFSFILLYSAFIYFSSSSFLGLNSIVFILENRKRTSGDLKSYIYSASPPPTGRK